MSDGSVVAIEAVFGEGQGSQGGAALDLPACGDGLGEWSDIDEHGRYWPDGLSAAELADRPQRLQPARSAWCYGTPGIARALHLAGSAFGRPEWTSEAVSALGAMLRRPLHSHGVADAGLCHGWAGLLHLVLSTGRETCSPELLAGADRLVVRVLDAYDPDSAFGFRAQGTDDTAGFLEGATGIALALSAPVQTYAYLTAPDRFGSRPHRDAADVFAVQIEGSKQ